jgi:hypothetical protein
MSKLLVHTITVWLQKVNEVYGRTAVASEIINIQ